MKQLTLLIIICIGSLISCQSSQPSPVEAYPYQLQSNGKWGLINKEGKIEVAAGNYLYRPTAVVNGLFSVPDSTGSLTLYQMSQPAQPVSPRRFASIGYFFEQTAPAQEKPGGPILLIDRQGNTCFSSDTDSPYPLAYLHNFSEGRALAITTRGKYGYLDTQGKWIIPPIYQRAYDFHQGLALVGTENTQGQMGYQLIDRDGKQILSIRQSPVWLDNEVHDDLLLMKNLHTQQFCYMSTQGKNTLYLPQEITDATAFRHGIAAVQTAQGWGVIDTQGNFILPPHFQQIYIAKSDRIWVKQEGLWALFTHQGKALSAFSYETPQKYLANEWNVAQVIIDSMALQLRPQSFQIKMPSISAITPNNTVSQSTPTKKDQPRPSLTKSDKKTTILPEQNWQEVSKKNPFYTEVQKVLSGKLQETDAKNRRMILNYVEHFRTAYTTKDIDFLEQVFSEQALIIVGKVIRSAQQPEGGFLTPDQIIYQVKSKRQYLDRLKQVFQSNQKINLKFSDFHIMRHPTNPNIYGVSLRQGYASDFYADDGYLFLLWDFSDETAPKIHVRTWQPSMLNDHTPLPEEEIFNIRHFNLK